MFMYVHGIVLLATLHGALKKQAEERALDVQEAIEKGSSVENGPSTVRRYMHLLVDGFNCSPVELILDVHKVPMAAMTCVPLTDLARECTCTLPSCDEGCTHQHSIVIHF